MHNDDLLNRLKSPEALSCPRCREAAAEIERLTTDRDAMFKELNESQQEFAAKVVELEGQLLAKEQEIAKLIRNHSFFCDAVLDGINEIRTSHDRNNGDLLQIIKKLQG